MLVRGICGGNHDLATARVSSHAALVLGGLAVLLAAVTDRLLPPDRVLLVVLLIILTDLGLVRHRVSHRVHVVVLELLLVRDLNCSFVIHFREHSELKPLADEFDMVFADVQLEHNLKDLVPVADARKGSDSF